MASHPTPYVGTIAELRRIVRGWREAGETIGLVPTMGALHEGHLELVRLAKSRARRVVTSIFVNPAQFAPHEDLDRYPRDLAADLSKLAMVGGDLVWAPSVVEMYPEGFATRVVPGGAAEGLESDFRPHFFAGVATVCCKLFTQVAPDFAVFGEKDYQQLCVIRQVVRDLNLPLEIMGAAIVREHDGLAMSSRNRYLTPEERKIAPALYRAISELAAKLGSDPAGLIPSTARTRIDALCNELRNRILEAGFGKVDYVCVRHAHTLHPIEQMGSDPQGLTSVRALAAAWLGKTRLIDNVPVPPR